MQEIRLTDFLQQQESEGKLDSDGQFTLSTEEAAQKLAKFTLPEPYSWVLKIVQAAVAWNSPHLKIRQTHPYTSFYFCPGKLQELPKEDQFQAALISCQLGKPTALHHLATALRSLVEQAGLSFVLAVQDEEKTYSIYAGEFISTLPESKRQEWAQLEGPGFRLTVGHQGQEQVGRGQSIAEQLRKKAFMCPIPLELDAQAINNLFDHADYGFTEKKRPLLLAELSTSTPHHFLDVPDDFQAKRLTLFHTAESARKMEGKPIRLLLGCCYTPESPVWTSSPEPLKQMTARAAPEQPAITSSNGSVMVLWWTVKKSSFLPGLFRPSSL